MNKELIQRLERTIDAEYSNTVGIVVYQEGTKQYERYFKGYSAQNIVHVFSVTKSVVSLLIGMASDRGLLDVDQRVLDFFPDYSVLPGERTLQSITVKNLLTMTAPYKYQTEPYETFFASPHPIKDALDLLGGDNPIGQFHYAAIGGTHILSGIFRRATGQSLLSFAEENLFSPMEIHVPHALEFHSEEEQLAAMHDPNLCGWVVDPQGNSMASWGLFLTPVDMAKLGQLVLNRGIWNGRRLVSAQWIAESTKEQSRCMELANVGYGYLWWIPGKTVFAAMGDGGNVIYGNTEKRLVVSVASLFEPDAKDRIPLIQKYIEPIFEK